LKEKPVSNLPATTGKNTPRPYDTHVIGAVQDATLALVNLGGDGEQQGLLIVPGTTGPSTTTVTATVIPQQRPAPSTTAATTQPAPVTVIRHGHLNFALGWSVAILATLAGVEFGILPDAANLIPLMGMIGAGVHSEVRS
jgi:hypothetical protein